MNTHKRKMAAPILITVFMVIYYIVFFVLIVSYLGSMLLKILLGIIPAVLAGFMVYVCIERIKEIEGGEEDDLGKY